MANIGNFHCLAFRLQGGRIAGVFEHHTGEVTLAKLDGFLTALADSTLRHQDVFDDLGHGALVYEPAPLAAPRFLAVTGPRRSLMRGSRLHPYFAVPQGDMMLAGCFGLLAAAAETYPEWSQTIQRSLNTAGPHSPLAPTRSARGDTGTGGAAPWELD